MFWVNVYLAGFLICLVIYAVAEPSWMGVLRALRWPLLLVTVLCLLLSWGISEIWWRWFMRRRISG